MVERFFGLWVPKDENIDTIIKSGIWENKLANKERAPKQLQNIKVGDKVFLFSYIEDVPLKSSPYIEYIDSNDYNVEKIVKAKSFAIGEVEKIDLENNNLYIKWDKNYTPVEWYNYYRQDGVWYFDLKNSTKQQKEKYEELYKMVFEGKKQDYKWWLDKGVLNRYKKRDLNKKENKMSTNFNIKNTILYGPPGVGKTYNHKKLVALIEGNDFSQQDIFDFIINNKDEEIKEGSVDKLFNKVQEENRIKFITFHQSFGYEDFIEGFRPNEEGHIELVDGVFKAITKEAQENLENSKKEQSFDIEQFLNDFVTFVESKEKFEIDKDLPIEVNKNSNGEFKSFKTKGRVKNQSLTYKIIKRDFENFLNNKIKDFKDIKPSFESSNKYHGNALYYFKLYQKMKEFLKDNEANYRLNKTKLNYYLIIDEINRANISKVFGELITLIEEDKRDSLEVTLPYSKEPFGVPSNLYIIGTLNSTDKSIALLDIALRRRFTFLKMKPNVDLVLDEAKEMFIKLNNFIKETLGEDYQIGHSYFMNIEASDLDFVLEYKIKPLLEEYFYGDKEKLEQVLKIIGDI